MGKINRLEDLLYEDGEKSGSEAECLFDALESLIAKTDDSDWEEIYNKLEQTGLRETLDNLEKLTYQYEAAENKTEQSRLLHEIDRLGLMATTELIAIDHSD